MDRIDVARNGGVAATDIARDSPCSCGRRSFPRSRRFSLPRSRGRVGVGVFSMQVGTGFVPDSFAVDTGLGQHVELTAAGMLAQVRRANTEVEALVGTERALLGDPVRHMDEAG